MACVRRHPAGGHDMKILKILLILSNFFFFNKQGLNPNVRHASRTKTNISTKHLRDISDMLEISMDQIDLNLLEAKIKEFKLEDEWGKIKKRQ